MADDPNNTKARRFEALKERLKTSGNNTGETITQIKEFLDKFPGSLPDQPNYYGTIMQDLLDTLKGIQCKFTNCPENTARMNIIEIIMKCPNFEIIRNFYMQLFKAVEEMFTNDNEDNSSLALKLFIDLTKAYKEMNIESIIQKFIKFADTMFRKSEEIARIAIERGGRNDLIPSQDSFKVLIECGSVITSLYHHFQRIVPIKDFIALAFDIVTREDPKDITKHPKVYNDYIQCKTKTFSFLAQFAQSEQINRDLRVPTDKLPGVLLKMMKNIPSDMYNMKKDIFQGFSLIIKSPTHKQSFSKHIDSFLEENEMNGNSSSIRASWYACMLEFIDTFKGDMTHDQLSKAVALVCKNIHHFTSIYQSQSVNTLKLLLDSIKNLKERSQRSNYNPAIDTMYFMILNTLSKRLSCYKVLIDEMLIHAKEMRGNNQRANLNVNDPLSQYKKVAEIAKTVIGEKHHSNAQFITSPWDQSSVKIVTKIIKNIVSITKVYQEFKYEREEAWFYDNISMIFYNISSNQGSQHIFNDIFQTLLPFLFLMSAEFSNLNKLFDNLSRNFKDNNKCLGDTIMPFIIDNLELIEQDSPIAETKILALHSRAKIPLPNLDKKEYRKKLGKRLNELLDTMLTAEVLEIHGKRLIQKCEELCRDETIQKYVNIARSCIKKVFHNRAVRNELATSWIQQHEPLLLPSPPYHLIYESLCGTTPEKISQACTLLEENYQSMQITPEIIKRLYDMMHSPKEQKDALRLISKLGSSIRNSRSAVSVKVWSGTPNIIIENPSYIYAFTFDLNYDPKYPPIKIPMDYVISKINNSLKAKTTVDENQKKTIQAASKTVSICILNLLSKLKIDTKLVASKVAFIVLGRKDDYVPKIPLIPEIHRASFTNTLKNLIEVLISLISIPDTVEDLSELYETVFIHMGFLMFSSLEGNYTDIGFNTLEILNILCGKLKYLEKDNDKRFKASLKGLNNIITTVSKILGRNDHNLYKSETIKQILQALIRTCYQSDWTTQFGACGGLFRLLRGFPQLTIKDFSMQLLKTSLHVLQSFTAVCKSQLSDEIIQLFKEVYEKCERSKVLYELVQGILSQSPNLRYICRKLIVDYNLTEEISKTSLPVIDKNSEKTIATQIKDLIFSQTYKAVNISTRAMLLETLNFCIKKRIITLVANKTEVVQFLLHVEEYFKEEQKDQKRGQTENPEKYITEKIAAFECMKGLLEEEDFWIYIRENDKETSELRYKITSRFLRAVGYHTDQHIVSIVKSGIEILLKKENNSRHILPQLDLKDCLRPILSDLAKNNNLPSLQLITNFSRLLEVISDCFNVNLGSRLITHINRIETQNKELLPLIPAIANLFYLMPRCTEDILTNVIQGFSKAEENLQKNQLQGYLNSFFTAPLIRYITRFPEKTLKYFFEEKKNLKFFTNLISHPIGYPLRDIIAREYHKYIDPLLSTTENKDYLDAIKITNALVKYMPRWISTKPEIISRLRTIYNEAEYNTNESEIIERSYMHKYILKAFISFIRFKRTKGLKDILLELPVAYGKKNIWNLEFLSKFLKKELVSILSTHEKKTVLKIIMKYLHEPNAPTAAANAILNDKKNKVLEYLLIPFIGECFKDPKKSQIVTKSIHISTIRLIRKHLTDYLNTCCVHLMNLGSMLIENFESEFFHYRKELIKFYWGMIKSDNPFIKGSAYVNVARFIGVYNLPDSLTVQLLGALFKAHHAELVNSAHQAFACLSDKLIQFFKEVRFREYLTEYVRKYLYQETRQFQSMIHVIDIIIKNSNVFYYIRDGLITHFLNWINHLGLGLHSNYNAKKTLLELTAVMIKFSEQHSKENPDSYINTSHKEMLINFFARFGQAPALYISRNPQRSFEQMNILSGKCIENMKNALKLWGEVNFKAKNWTEALKKCVNLVQQHHLRNNAADALKKLLERSLNIIKILSEHNTRTAIIQYPELVKYLALQVKSTENPGLTKSLCETVSILLANSAEELRKQLNEILEASFTTDSNQNSYWTVQLLYNVIKVFPDDVVQHMKGLLALTLNLIKENTSEQKEVRMETIQLALLILQNSMSHLTDENKKSLKSIIATIFENHSELKSIITAACKVMESWLVEYDQDNLFKIKEQCSILTKLFTGYKLDIKYSNLPLELAIRILSSTSDCYEPRILLCKAVLQYLLMDPGNEFKPQVNQILKELIGVSIWRRLLFVFDQNDSTDSRYWIRLSLDILLGSLEDSAVVEYEEMEEDIETQLDRNTAELLRQHFKYIKNNRIRQARELVNSLRHLTNFQIASSLFVHIFPQIWASLSPSQQNSLVFTMETMFITRQPNESSELNSFKSILTAITCCNPLPSIRPEILQYLAKVHNAWNICIPLLETYANHLPDKEKPLLYLEQLHSRIGERELSLGYKLLRCKNPACRTGLKQLLVSEWQEASETFESLMASETEDSDIAREGWDESIEKLADWKTLLQYGESRQDMKVIDWYWQEKKYSESKSLIKNLNLSNHPVCIYYKCVESFENKNQEELSLKEIENEIEVSSKEIWSEWASIPKHPSVGHINLVQLLELRNEVNDGVYLLRNLEEVVRNSRNSEKNETIEKWRNKPIRIVEGLRFWGMCFRMRRNIAKQCLKIIERGGKTISVQFDPVSEINTLDMSYVGLLRKVGAYQEALDTLKNSVTRERGNDPYYKNIEDVKLAMSYGDLEGALGIANFCCCNTDNYSREICADFRRLKGKIYKKKGNIAMAIRCLKNAYQGNPKVMHSLLSLGKVLCIAYPEPKPAEANEILCCFLLGIQHKIYKHKSYVPRILNLLDLCDNFDKWNEYADKIFSISVPWLFQILKKIENNSKNFSKVFEGLLRYAIENHPQALFFSLRCFVEKRLPMEKSLPTAFKVCYLELKKVHGILVQSLENLCENLTTCFKPTLEEELYSIFNTMIYVPLDYPIEEYREIFDMIKLNFMRKENEDFYDKYSKDFYESFSELNTQSMDSILAQVKCWKDRLASEIKQYETRYIDQDCPELTNFFSKEIELPLNGESPVILERIHPRISTIKTINCKKVVTFKGSNGRDYEYLVSYQGDYNIFNISQIINSLYHYIQIGYSNINHRILASNFEPQAVQALGHHYFLIEVKAKSTSLLDIYELTVNEELQDPDKIVLNNGHVPNYLFSSYMQRIFQSPNRYSVFTKQFTAQWALLYVFCSLFNVALCDIQLSKIWVSLKSGVISFALFDVNLLDQDTGEFRLTPNLLEVIGPAGVAGMMPAVILSVFKVLRKELPQLHAMVKLVLSDKVVEIEKLKDVIENNCQYDYVVNRLEEGKEVSTDSSGWISSF